MTNKELQNIINNNNKEICRQLLANTYEGKVYALRDNGKWTLTRNWRKCNKIWIQNTKGKWLFKTYPKNVELMAN